MVNQKQFVVPEFGTGSVPVSVAATVFGKDACWVRAGIISGWLAIGFATRDYDLVKDVKDMNSRYGRISYYISPRLLWELTGYVWKGKGKGGLVSPTDEERKDFMANVDEMINEFLGGEKA